MAKLNISELIRIAKENKDKIFNTDVSKDLDEATKFSLVFKIKAGGNKVLSTTIYKAYTTWAVRPQPRTKFLEDFASLFEKGQGSNARFYMLNYKPAQLVNEATRRKIDFEK